ncbi:DUF7427 family protein [Williamsia sterculiae]|uniref:Uncharacterized protein n=1 Tax=Williamsia sterculiae TaxID=1344003 RepID=A0A1N7GHP0_9NOCA|nr:hypothetical protein SAMN05445060_2805 [Williamsia sterculiae]
MERPRPSTIAWAGLAGAVAVYDLTCSPGETLSEGVDAGLETKYKRLIQLGIGLTALHLLNLCPSALDPLHQLTRLKAQRSDRQ